MIQIGEVLELSAKLINPTFPITILAHAQSVSELVDDVKVQRATILCKDGLEVQVCSIKQVPGLSLGIRAILCSLLRTC